jgi:uncharacterized protein (DUF608 family)
MVRSMISRRTVLSALGAGAAAPLALRASDSRPWPFEHAKLHEWTAIHADGFKNPVTGLVFDGSSLESGVPLGGIGTGYFTLEGDGKIGLCSIYNDWVPPKRIFADWLFVESGTRRVPLSASRTVYWGHFPVADLRASFPEIPLEVGLRAFAPFLPGDSAVSNTPAVVFDLELRNTSGASLPLNLAFRFPKPVATAVEPNALAVEGAGIQTAGEPGSYKLDLQLPPHSTKRLRFSVGWYAPSWRDSGHEPHINRYSTRFRSAEEVAHYALANADNLLKRILNWQTVLYQSDYPEWLRDALVQGLYSLTKNSIWIARTRKDEWWSDNGWFTHSESHTGCPIVETMVCRMHGHFAALYFFPDLETSTLEAFRHFQVSDGEIPFCFGQPTSMRDPRYHCQHPLNSGQYAQMVHQLYLRTGDRAQLNQFYDSAKRAIRYQYSLDNDDCGLVHEQPHARPGEAWPANQFYDVWPWKGTSSYVAGTWLATLAAGKAMAEAAGDHQFANECAARLAHAQKSYNTRLWNGRYYRLWSNPAKNTSSDVCLANQLMAQWCAKVAGLGDILPEDRIHSALNAVEQLNAKATSYGLVNGVTPDGRPYDTKIHPVGDFGQNIFVGENLCAAMTFLYHGRRDAGLAAARAMYETMAIKTRSPWNQRCLLWGDTGLPLWGDDYYSNLAIWAVPMAVRGESLKDFSKSGLIPDMLNAARG